MTNAPAPLSSGDIMGSPALSNGLLLAAFAIIFYFLFIRPQNKRAKEHRQLVANLQIGDEVITNGGLLGKITGVNDNFFVMTVAEGVEILVQRNAIVTMVPKNTLQDIKKSMTH